MSAALTYIILGTANFFGPQSSPNISQTFSNSIPSPAERALQPQTLHDNYTYTPNVGMHKVHNELEDWNEARRTCQEEGGHLVIINSAAEAQVVGQLMRNLNLNWAHIGFHDIFQEGEYVTVLGAPLAKTGYEVWNEGEPNNWDNNEDCGVMWTDGTLNDGRCQHRHNFVCELPQVEPCATKYQQSLESTPAVELVGQVSRSLN